MRSRQRISAAAPAAKSSTAFTPLENSARWREGELSRRQRQDEAIHQVSQRRVPQTKHLPELVLIQLGVKGQDERKGQKHQEHQDLKDLRGSFPSRPDVLGVDRRRERSEGLVLNRPASMCEFAHLERGEGLIRGDDPEGLLCSFSGTFKPLELHASDLERMRALGVTKTRKRLDLVL